MFGESHWDSYLLDDVVLRLTSIYFDANCLQYRDIGKVGFRSMNE
jgi:hypothetical protein